MWIRSGTEIGEIASAPLVRPNVYLPERLLAQTYIGRPGSETMKADSL